MTLKNILDFIIPLLGYVTAATGVVAFISGIAWAVFRAVSKKWLDAKFAERFADYQHRQTLQGDAFRSDLAALLDRATKLHAQEFEVLPKAWELLTTAMGLAGQATSMVTEHPDVARMTEPEFEVALTHQPFKDHEKDRMRALDGEGRAKLYRDLYDRYRFYAAWEAGREFRNFVILKGIFIEKDLRIQIRKVADGLDDILWDYRFGKWEQGERMNAAQIKSIRDKWAALQPERDVVEESVSARLWSKPVEEKAAV
jgi:hypothetical protein